MASLARKPGRNNWIETELSPATRAAWKRSIIHRAAEHMVKKGMPVSIAIPSAINWAKHICTTGDVRQWRGPQSVNPKSRAECCAAVALWNAMRAEARAKRG